MRKPAAFFAAWAVGTMAILSPGRAFAYFGSVTPPPGFSSSGGVTFYGGAGASTAWNGGRVAGTVTAQIGSKFVGVPTTARLASNAASYAVAAVRLNPAALATGFVATWLLTYGLQYVGGQWQKSGVPTEEYYLTAAGAYAGWRPYSTLAEVCTTLALVLDEQNYQGYYAIGYLFTGTPLPPNQCRMTTSSGYQVILNPQFRSTGVTGGTAPAVESDWNAPAAAPRTQLTDQLLNQLRPVVPLPVEAPVFNPDPAFAPQPITIPTGLPAPIPGTTPQQYRQPTTRIVGSPTTADPWQVDYQPGYIDGTSPTGIVDPVSGSGATQTPPQQVEVETCGLPDTPKCRIDETGTPEWQTPATPSTDNVPQALKDADAQKRQEVENSITAPTWGFLGTPPLTTCTPYQFPSVRVGSVDQAIPEVNPCGVVDGVRGFMAYLWALAGAWLCISMVRQTMNAS